MKRSFVAASSLLAVAGVTPASVQAQVAFFDARQFGSANLAARQSVSDADDFIARSGGAFEPIRALRSDDEIRRTARSIGRIDVDARDENGAEVSWSCTGTLLPHGHVLTNNHCIPGHGRVSVVRALIWMNYLEQGGGGARRFDLAVPPIEADEKLDYSIVAVQGDAREFEGVRLSDVPVQPNQTLIVIHHPDARPMVMTRFRCQAYSEQPDHDILRHRCDTLPGSSGAMIFTSSLRGIALHFAGGMQAGDDHSFNSATRMTTLANASATIRASLAAADPAAAASTAAPHNENKVPGGGREDPTSVILQEAPR
ncbi:MAG: trypsin-like peptidase domain-containing protein [Bradyrhizobiaceae bacterium]|nr:trypsin-like peptidase domain-containing protein [Bradyrhizobiaceae bacterium]